MDNKLAKPIKDPFKPVRLGTRWLWFYTNAQILLALLFIFDYLYTEKYLFLIGNMHIGFSILLLFNYYGLSKRKRWGWNLNWLVLAIEALIYPAFNVTLSFESLIGYLFSAVVGGIFWILQNALYFSKRKHLFLKGGKTGT